uniref:Secreted protein n=1 Tax=Mesocestoides corti TaxID=53468 RepID=A0A5K3FGX5_MESCO
MFQGPSHPWKTLLFQIDKVFFNKYMFQCLDNVPLGLSDNAVWTPSTNEDATLEVRDVHFLICGFLVVASAPAIG